MSPLSRLRRGHVFLVHVMALTSDHTLATFSANFLAVLMAAAVIKTRACR